MAAPKTPKTPRRVVCILPTTGPVERGTDLCQRKKKVTLTKFLHEDVDFVKIILLHPEQGVTNPEDHLLSPPQYYSLTMPADWYIHYIHSRCFKNPCLPTATATLLRQHKQCLMTTKMFKCVLMF